MTDGIATGWHHALWLLGYLCGLLPVLALTALLVVLALTIGPQIRHQVRVHRIRRQARRDGRATDRIMARTTNIGRGVPPYPFPCHCPSLPPGRRDLTGHEPGCPDHPTLRSGRTT